MKKATIARFVIGLAAISAVGCSAETGTVAEGSIGSSSEALSQVSATDLTAAQSPLQERLLPASCRFKVSSTEYAVAFGGYSASGSPKSDIIAAPLGGTWVQAAGSSLGTARGDLKAYPIDDTHCLLIGGSTVLNTTDSAVVELVTFSAPSGVPTVAITGEHALGTARSKFQVSTCTDNSGNDHVVVVGGGNAAGRIATMEVSPALNNLANLANAWSTPFTVLLRSRFDFGFAKEPGSNFYLVTGGNSSSAVKDSSIEAIKLASDCTLDRKNLISSVNLSHPVAGSVAFPNGTANKFIATAGTWDNSGTLTLNDKADTIDVNWAATPIALNAAISSATITAQGFRPELVKSDAATQSYLMAGGFNAAQTAGVTTVQQFTPAGGFAAGTALNAATFGGSTAYFPTAGKVVIVGGATALSAGTYTLTLNVDAYTTP